MQTFYIKNDFGGHFASVNIMCMCVCMYITDLKAILQLCLIMGVYRDTEVICYTVMYWHSVEMSNQLHAPTAVYLGVQGMHRIQTW